MKWGDIFTMNGVSESIVALAASAIQAATSPLEFLESRPDATKAILFIMLVGLAIDFINPQMTSNQTLPSVWRLASPMFAALWLMSPATAQGMTATMLMLPLYIRLPALTRRFVTQVTPSAVYICTMGTLAVRAPRFRNRDLFKHGNLCQRCQQAIGASHIFRGSCALVVRTTERHFMYDSLDEMQTLGIGCHLCEALLGQRTADAAPGTSAAAASWHGNRERVYLKVEFTQAHSIVDHLIIGYKTAPLLLSLETGSGAMFDKLQLSESEYNSLPTCVYVRENWKLTRPFRTQKSLIA